MMISELIDKLETMRARYGEMRVKVRNTDGNWGAAEEIYSPHPCLPASVTQTLYIDS